MDNETINRLLAGLGEYIRPLLSEAGNVMGMDNAGFIGICFSNPDDSTTNVLFAEYVNPANRQGSYEGNYILPTTCAFVRALLSCAQENIIWYYAISSDEPRAVVEPFAKEFPNATAPQAIFARNLDPAGGAILYFISASESTFVEFPDKLFTAQTFLIKTLRDALFLAATADLHLVEWSDKLIAKLPEVFPTYSEAQKRALAKVRHPYLQWQEGRSEEPTIEGFQEKDRDFILAIRGAVKVKETGLLSGSFQDHNVYSAEIWPSGEARMFAAAIKFAPQSRANKEIRGYFSLLPYFREIREVMPSAPLVFPTGKKVEDKSGRVTGEDKYTVVTPHLGGQSLYDFIRSKWSEDVDRVLTLRKVFHQLRKAFVENIRPPVGPEEQVAPFRRLYDSHLSNEQRKPGNRFDKTTRQLKGWLPDGLETSPLLSAFGDHVCNPLWMLESSPLETEAAKIVDYWQTVPRERRMVRFGHGDFHVGNVLFAPADGRVTVLDFDYVGDHPEHEDPATLETSFVLAAAANSLFHDKSDWMTSWPDTIRFLSGVLPWKSVQNNRLAHDVAQLVAEIRAKQIPQPQNVYMADDHHYHACLATALLRLFTSHSQKMDEVQFRPVGATALFWLGLLLKRLVRCPAVENPIEIDLFDMLRKQSTTKKV